MIPWVREKFAERRAKWLAARNKRSTNKSEDEDDNSSTSASDIAPRLHRLQDNPEESANSSNATVTAPVPTSGRSPLTPQTAHRSMRGSSATSHCHHHHHSSSSSCSLTNSTSNNIKLNKIRSSRRSSAASSSVGSCHNNDDILKGPSTKERIKVRIVCPSARILVFQTDINRRLLELKSEILLELKDDMGSMPLFATDPRSLGPKFRLLKADYQGSELNENLTLAQLEIGNNDTLVLVAKRNHLQNLMTQTRETRTPPEAEIEMATRSLPVRTSEIPMVDINEIFQQSNLQFDVRKVLISLAQASSVIIGSGPYANRLIAMLKQKLINKRNYQNDTLQCLVDMGFKKEKAEYALKIHNNIYSNALEWLILRQSEEMGIEETVMGLPRTNSIASPSGIISNDGPIDNIAALLEIVRIYSHRDIPPTPETIQNLVEMGFPETEVIEALKKTCNNKAAACEWLCGNRTGSLVELREGLAQDSPILKTILELPQVQLSLSNPKILLAFLAILENEHTIRVWGGDNDTTSVITHILQKYHEEKHVLGINQFYSSR
ncbi:ubiquitin-associated domain-containing protein 1 isoform X1 [Lucilia cuprina]|uniref:ubiquitin-associated domain-containing protein 1 isoform X1 n=1 Tax=Lucilia cuprina TaxID=7375 RepID=UPI001F066922|nr:ubiquitin-associated domain-containing protein 1 isoform X1 [Lucilia cuprina]